MDLLRERLKARGAQCAILRGGGGDSSSTTGATTTTTNTDRRAAIQDGVGITGDGSSYSSSSSTYLVDNSNSSDAIKAIAGMGADVIKDSGGAVVELYEAAGQRTSDTWNKTLTEGARLVDKLIDKAAAENSLASKVVDSFEPNENKNTDAFKWVALAAAAVGVAAMWKTK